MKISREIHANADPSCVYCEGEVSVSIELETDKIKSFISSSGNVSHLVCDCVSTEAIPNADAFLDWLDTHHDSIPEAGEEICVSKTVMLTNPDYLSEGLPSWENDSAEVNPISALFEEKV